MYLPSCVVTVIAALPNPTAVIVPLLSTVATFMSLEVQATHLSVAYSGNTVGIKVSVSSINKVVECLFSVTSVTWIESFFSDPQLVDIAAATAPIVVILM